MSFTGNQTPSSHSCFSPLINYLLIKFKLPDVPIAFNNPFIRMCVSLLRISLPRFLVPTTSHGFNFSIIHASKNTLAYGRRPRRRRRRRWDGQKPNWKSIINLQSSTLSRTNRRDTAKGDRNQFLFIFVLALDAARGPSLGRCRPGPSKIRLLFGFLLLVREHIRTNSSGTELDWKISIMTEAADASSASPVTGSADEEVGFFVFLCSL